MRRIFGSRPTRFQRGDAVKLKTAIPNDRLESGMVGTISEVRRTKVPSYEVQFINVTGVVGRFVVDESDLMPADGREYDDNDVVKLRRDVPSQGLTAGTVGIVSEVSSGPPVAYVVEFVNASGATIARTTLSDEDLSSPDEAPERAATPQDERGLSGIVGEGPDETGLADDQFDELIAELRTQGQAMQQQSAQERNTEERPEPEPEAQSEPKAEPARPAEQPVGGTRAVTPSDGRATKFVRDEVVRLNVGLPSEGFEAGTEGTVTWVILGPPIAYLVEFRDASGGVGRPTRVEETYLSFAD